MNIDSGVSIDETYTLCGKLFSLLSKGFQLSILCTRC